jgi:hypothetical protein
VNADEPRPRCPVCGGEGIPVMYGLPSLKNLEETEQGLYKLGGCELPGHGKPVWSCPNDHEFTTDHWPTS